MRIIREVPISEITNAMMRFVDEDRDGPNQPFFTYASENDIWRNGSMAEDAMRAILPNLPECEASAAFTAAANEALDRAVTDVPRPFDHIVLDAPDEVAVADDLAALADEIEQASPLLAPVADVLGRSGLGSAAPANLGELHAWIGAINGDALLTGLPEDGYCDKHGEHCYPDSAAKTVPWEHVEYLAPGTRPRIQGIVHRLTDFLPPATADSAVDRFSPAYLSATARKR